MKTIRTTLTMLFLLSYSMIQAAPMGITRAELKEMTTTGHQPINDYREARKVLFGSIHLQSDEQGDFVVEVYCRKEIRGQVGPGKIPNANNVNTEHTWPKSRFNKRESYQSQLTDLHHLYPTDSKANSTRSSWNFGEVASQRRDGVSNCEASRFGNAANSGNDAFEPPDEHKGNVARALFYFAVRYDLRIRDDEEFYLKTWNITDPVDEDEIRRNNIVESVQGNRNPFIDDSSLAELVADF